MEKLLIIYMDHGIQFQVNISRIRFYSFTYGFLSPTTCDSENVILRIQKVKW